MPVNTPHSTYARAARLWEITRDCLEGAQAIKERGTTYLPKLTEQDDTSYSAYLLRANFFNVTGRTHEAMTGTLWRKPPTLEDSLEDAFMGNVDLQGSTFDQYATKVTAAVASVGRAGTLVDWNDTENRPYLALYTAENIVNWRTTVVDGKKTLQLLVLREFEDEMVSDEFEIGQTEIFRVYRLMDGVVTVEVYKGSKPSEIDRDNRDRPANRTPSVGGTSDFALVESSVPQRRGKALDMIPFIFHGAQNSDPEIGLVPLADIAHLNVAHYRNSADMENGLHICGIPTPIAAGFPTDGKLYLGSNHAWISEDPAANATFLEFTGSGLAAFKAAMDDKQAQMAALGARMIEPRQADAEAFETVALRNSAETSALARMGREISHGLTIALQWCDWWQGTIGKPSDSKTKFCLHRDFSAIEITPDKMNALIAAWQQNAISYETLFAQLQRGEVIAEGRTLEEERDAIETSPPMPAPKAAPIPPGDPMNDDPNAPPAKKTAKKAAPPRA